LVLDGLVESEVNGLNDGWLIGLDNENRGLLIGAKLGLLNGALLGFEDGAKLGLEENDKLGLMLGLEREGTLELIEAKESIIAPDK
jgi:hypothetical protein